MPDYEVKRGILSRFDVVELRIGVHEAFTFSITLLFVARCVKLKI